MELAISTNFTAYILRLAAPFGCVLGYDSIVSNPQVEFQVSPPRISVSLGCHEEYAGCSEVGTRASNLDSFRRGRTSRDLVSIKPVNSVVIL